MNIETIDPFKLPTISLLQRSNLPMISAVYFVLHENEVVYVGRSHALKQRWESHHRLKELNNLSGQVRIAWFICDNPELMDGLEKLMIDQFKPRMNGSKVEHETPQRTIYIEPQLMKALKERAKEEKRTASNLCSLLIEQAMTGWLNQKEQN